ncbi:ABC transporter permease [Streptomyces sviceus]|uniref:ABC transporter permease n=1 Tax=Streptomyces sviceus TaxID=285530 RepID=UPI0036BA736B
MSAGVQGGLRLIERHVRAYRHSWLLLASGALEPVLYLFSIGTGVGTLVGQVAGPDGEPVRYAAYIAPALLATAAMNGTIADSTFNVFFRLKYTGLYSSALATRMRPSDITVGEIGWSVIRGVLYAAAFMGVCLAMGLTPSPWALLGLPVVMLMCFAIGAASMAATTYMKSILHFEFVPLVVLPMFLFSGTFYPIDVYPRFLQILVECLPFYQGVALLRGLNLGAPDISLWWHVGYLLALGLVGAAIVRRRIGTLLLT